MYRPVNDREHIVVTGHIMGICHIMSPGHIVALATRLHMAASHLYLSAFSFYVRQPCNGSACEDIRAPGHIMTIGLIIAAEHIIAPVCGLPPASEWPQATSA